MMRNANDHQSDDERVRDHLANERTYLAWLRTGMAMMGFGVVIAKLRYLFAGMAAAPQSAGMIHASNTGLLVAVIGLGILTMSGWRYAAVREQIRAKNYRAPKYLAIVLSSVIIALGVLIIGYLLQDMIAGNG